MADATSVVAAAATTGQTGLDAPPSSEHHGTFTLEQRGIELIPEAERPMKPSGSFFSNRTHGADFSRLFGLIVSAAAYYLLSASSVRKKTVAQK
jgi:hypothetical protein